jgi:putative membrane protein
MQDMVTLILNVDRDNDYGMKAGIEGPVTGYGDCYNAALKLISVDPEDSDANALFGTIKVYEELKRKNENVEIALITGDDDVGAKSDEILSKQLDDVLSMEHYDDLILVSDGAEDDYITPIISSRIRIRYVKHILVRHNENIESLYYYIIRGIRDKKIARKFTIPVGLLLLSYGVSLLVFTLYYMVITKSYIINPGSGAVMLVTIVLGAYFVSRAVELNQLIIKLAVNMKEYSQEAKISLLSYVVSFFIVIIGIAYSYESTVRMAPIMNKILLFLTVFVWWIFASFVSKELFDAFDIYMEERHGMSRMWYGIAFSLSMALIFYGMINYIRYIVGFIPLAVMTVYFGYIIAGILIALSASAVHKYFSSLKNKNGNVMEIK